MNTVQYTTYQIALEFWRTASRILLFVGNLGAWKMHIWVLESPWISFFAFAMNPVFPVVSSGYAYATEIVLVSFSRSLTEVCLLTSAMHYAYHIPVLFCVRKRKDTYMYILNRLFFFCESVKHQSINNNCIAVSYYYDYCSVQFSSVTVFMFHAVL